MALSYRLQYQKMDVKVWNCYAYSSRPKKKGGLGGFQESPSSTQTSIGFDYFCGAREDGTTKTEHRSFGTAPEPVSGW
jgi:hypothetical protein